jgi:hypothetical protein
MGVGLVPFYEPEVLEEARYNGDGKRLAMEYTTLNDIAVKAGLRPLSQFAQGEFEDYSDDATEPSKTAELIYHPANEGLSVVEGLIREIRSSPTFASRLDDSAFTLEELEELARSLRAAEQSGARFCLYFM